jgi:hypothetical protein
MGMAVCCGAAFLTHYLTLFSVSVILLWFVAHVRPALRLKVILPLIFTASLALLGLFTRSGLHYGRPRLQPFGFLSEIRALVRMNLDLLWYPLTPGRWVSPTRVVLFVLVGTSILLLVFYWPRAYRKFWSLLLALVIVPSIGIMALGLRSSWQLHEIRYVAWAGPALAVVAANGIVKLTSIRPPWGWSLLAVLLVVQLTSLNWGKEDAFVGARWRSLAKTNQTSSSSRVVVIGGGRHPGLVSSRLNLRTEPQCYGSHITP